MEKINLMPSLKANLSILAPFAEQAEVVVRFRHLETHGKVLLRSCRVCVGIQTETSTKTPREIIRNVGSNHERHHIKLTLVCL